MVGTDALGCELEVKDLVITVQRLFRVQRVLKKAKVDDEGRERIILEGVYPHSTQPTAYLTERVVKLSPEQEAMMTFKLLGK